MQVPKGALEAEALARELVEVPLLYEKMLKTIDNLPHRMIRWTKATGRVFNARKTSEGHIDRNHRGKRFLGRALVRSG